MGTGCSVDGHLGRIRRRLEYWSGGVLEKGKFHSVLDSLRQIPTPPNMPILPILLYSNTPFLPSTLWRQVADDIARFNGPRDQLVFLRQVDCRLKILLRNPFFEGR